MGIGQKINSNHIYVLSFIAVLALFPWSLRLANYAIVIMVVAGLWSSGVTEKIKKIKKHPEALVFLLFFSLYILGLFYSDNILLGIKSIEQKLVLLIFPLIAISSVSFTSDQKKLALLSFVCSQALLTIVCVILNIVTISRGGLYEQINFDPYNLARFNELHPDINPLWMQFSYLSFGEPITNSPVFLSIYLTFCVLILLYTNPTSSKLVLLKYVAIAWFCISIILLSSRMGIFILLFIGAVNFLLNLIKQQFPLKDTVASISILLTVCTLILVSPVTRFRVIEEPLMTPLAIPSDSTRWNSVNLHLLQWKSGIQGAKEYGVSGTGTGGTLDILKDYYAKANLGGFDKYHHVHNQFIETYLEIGAIGFIALLLCFIIPMAFALKNKDMLLLSFTVMIGLGCLSTSMFESGRGLTFYISFISLLLFTQNKDEHEIN